MNILKKTNWSSLKAAKEMLPEEVVTKVKESGLSGRGGAGFPTGVKWEFVNKTGKGTVLICNFDEGEPGTFKDKFILNFNAEALVEGMAIAAYALNCEYAYIYFRAEYEYLKEKLQNAIDNAPIDKLKIEIVQGAGAYICGDETSIMNSIEGLAGHPRNKPPYPAEKGLWQKPTCVNNVETLTNVSLLFQDGWNKKTRLFSVSGSVEGGVFERELGVNANDLIKSAKPKEKIKAIFFGAAGGCIPLEYDTVLDADFVKNKGAMLGSCTIIAVGESQNIVDICTRIQEFFVHESCGKCTPCREGNYRTLQLLQKINSGKGTQDDLALLEELANFTTDNSFCPLGQSSCTHIKTGLKHFREEFEEKCKSQ